MADAPARVGVCFGNLAVVRWMKRRSTEADGGSMELVPVFGWFPLTGTSRHFLIN